MDGEEKFWVSIWCIVGFIACVLISCITFYNCYTEKLYAENGYEKVPVIGYSVPVYQKVKKD